MKSRQILRGQEGVNPMWFFLKRGVIPVFAVAGTLLILLSMCTIQDLGRLDITYSPPVKVPPLVVGVCFIVLAIAWAVLPVLRLSAIWMAVSRITRCQEGFATDFAHAAIEIRFGRIEDFVEADGQDLAALPANDYFDDDCIRDPRSALGAFVNSMFPNRVHEVCQLAQQQVQGAEAQGECMATAPRRYSKGETLYFERPLGTNVRMAFVATTTVLNGEGINCQAQDVFAAMNGVHALMNEKRLDSVVLPLFGCGHGGLRPQVSLLCMLIALAERLSGPSGRHIKSVRIVVFQRDDAASPAIAKWQSRQLLGFAKRYCATQT